MTRWRAFLRGLSSISIFQPPIRRPFLDEGFEADRKALEADWDKVLRGVPPPPKEPK